MTALQQAHRTWLAVLIALSLALAGCSDDDDASSDEPADTDVDTGDTGTGDMDTGDAGSNDTAIEPAPPIYINGTVSGAIDCQLGPENAVMGDSKSVDPNAANRTYTLEAVDGNMAPAGFRICLVWAPGGQTGNSGTVPADATGVTVYVDGGESVGYSIKIE